MLKHRFCFLGEIVNFNRDYSDWQKASMAFDLSDGNASTNKKPDYISIGLRYYKQANTVYFDNVQLVKDISNSYTYDNEGNIIKTSESGKQSSVLTYNGDSDLTSVKDVKNNTYSNTYNDAHQVTEAVSPIGQKVQFTYNDSGSITASKIMNSGGDLILQSDTEYNEAAEGVSAGAYAVKTVDQNGNSAEYEYDMQSGLLESAEDAGDTAYAYTYDSTGNILTISEGERGADGTAQNLELLVSYRYDGLNQLIREDHAHLNKTIVYEYCCWSCDRSCYQCYSTIRR